MTTVFRSNRKATDDDIIRLNSVGLSLNTVATQLGCHPTTITLRLKDLGIDPSDTRRAFMEPIYMGMSKPEQEWLEKQARSHVHIRDYIRHLLAKEYLASKTPEPV